MTTRVRTGIGSNFVLALSIAAVWGGSCHGDEILTLQGGSPRILFDDITGFAQQWTLYANSTNFELENTTSGTFPFIISTAAPSNSLRVDIDGLIGLGTGSPARNLHVFSYDNPTIRFEQAEAVFAARTWDIGGNESNFFVLDVTSGNSPFMVRPGAPTSSVDIAPSGNVGFGTNNPLASVHIKKPALASTAELMARFETSDDTIGALSIVNASATNGNFIPKIQGRGKAANVSIIHEGLVVTDSGNDPAIAFNAQKSPGGALATRPLAIFRNNNSNKVIIGATGIVTATSFNSVSSREVKDQIRDLDSEKASTALRQLTPVEFVYKDDATAEPKVGFIAEDVPDIVAEPERKSVPVMDVVALLTRVVKDQDRLIDEQKKTNDRQQKTIDELVKRLEALEGKGLGARERQWGWERSD